MRKGVIISNKCTTSDHPPSLAFRFSGMDIVRSFVGGGLIGGTLSAMYMFHASGMERERGRASRAMGVENARRVPPAVVLALEVLWDLGDPAMCDSAVDLLQVFEAGASAIATRGPVSSHSDGGGGGGGPRLEARTLCLANLRITGLVQILRARSENVARPCGTQTVRDALTDVECYASWLKKQSRLVMTCL